MNLQPNLRRACQKLELGVHNMHPQENLCHLTILSKAAGANLSLLNHVDSHSKKIVIQVGEMNLPVKKADTQ